MKIPKLLLQKKKKKLRASTARRSISVPDEMDYEEMSEPNMKLSRALLIVLVLHVVAVAGIIAFNAIKTRQGAFAPSISAAAKTESAPAASPNAQPTAAAVASPALKSDTAAEQSPVPRALPVSNDSGNFYVVAKGDNPVKIAKKLKVSESDLLTVNHIDDPRKLQIGQKLIVPARKAAPKKSKD
jgi:LysM repeat protein